MGRPSVEWSTKLWEGLRVQFNKQKFSDLAVNVLGEILHVHRVVLSTQSDALSELLPTNSNISQGEIVHVHRVVLSTQSDALSELLPSNYNFNTGVTLSLNCYPLIPIHPQGEIVHVHRVHDSWVSLRERLDDGCCIDEAVMNWSAHCNDINHAKDFLKSLYYGYANVHQDNVLALLKLAKIYDVTWLVNEAESFARNHINHSNILEYLDFAVIYECTELKEACSAKLFKYNKKYNLIHRAAVEISSSLRMADSISNLDLCRHRVRFF
eukprot:sb/3468224/